MNTYKICVIGDKNSGKSELGYYISSDDDSESDDDITLSKKVPSKVVNKDQPLYGDSICMGTVKSTGNACTNKAYWAVGEEYLCGVHAKKYEKTKIQLVKRSAKETKKLKEESICRFSKLADAAAKKNKSLKKYGDIFCYKMQMCKKIIQKEGYMLVFPNNKHQNRADGYGCSSLSPMVMGPISTYGNLPDCFNLENFHQQSKCFKEEVDSEGNPSKEFYDNQKDGFVDKVPHRHKKYAKGNIPTYFVWIGKDGIEKHFQYVDSRQFYCNYYDRIGSKLEDFKHILSLLKNGYNIQICGYDSNKLLSKDNIDKWYLNSTKPFGHESVLFTMLLFELYPNDIEKPWLTHKTEDF